MSTEIAQPGNGADPAAGTQTAEPTGQAQPTGGQPSGGDYLAKIDSDAEFRRAELTKHQGRADRAETQLRQLQERIGPLSQILDGGVDGRLVAQVVQEYQALAQDPKIAQAIHAYREHGEVRLPGAQAAGQESTNVEDEYLTDTERQLRSELSSTREELKRLETQVSQTSQNFGVQSLTQHLEKAFDKHQIRGEKAEEVRQKVINQVQQWAQTPQGKQGIADLHDPGKAGQTVSMLVVNAMGGFDGLLEHAKQQLLREGKVRAGMETDGPSAIGSTGDESPVEHKSILDALRHAQAKPEVLSRYGGS